MNELPLRDIHLPEPVSWWPLATGWWLLLGLLVVMALLPFVMRYLRRRRSRPDYKRQALEMFRSIRQSEATNSVQQLRDISQLLRRVALSYLPRQQVASLTGQEWIAQLNQLVSETIFDEEDTTLISQASYRPQVDFDRGALLDRCEQWIKRLPAKPAERETSP